MARHALVLVTADRRALTAVERALPNGVPLRAVPSCEFVQMLARREIWAAIVDASAYNAELRGELVALKGAGTPLPVILFSPCDASAEFAATRGAHEVSYGDAECLLWPKVRARGSRMLLDEARELIQRRTRPGSVLRVALDAALAAPQPFSSIRELALRVQCDPSALQKAWKKATGGASSLSLGMVMDSILLLRLMGDDAGDGQLTARRRAWGIGRDRARRITQRAIHVSFAAMKGSAHAAWIDWFEVNVLSTLSIMQRTSIRWRTSGSPN